MVSWQNITKEIFFFKKHILLYSINWPSFIVWLPLLLEIPGNMCIVIVCYPVCVVINFKIHHSHQAVCLHDQKLRTKIEISQGQKVLLRWNKKAFYIIFKGLSVVRNCLRPASALLSCFVKLKVTASLKLVPIFGKYFICFQSKLVKLNLFVAAIGTT